MSESHLGPHRYPLKRQRCNKAVCRVAVCSLSRHALHASSVQLKCNLEWLGVTPQVLNVF